MKKTKRSMSRVVAYSACVGIALCVMALSDRGVLPVRADDPPGENPPPGDGIPEGYMLIEGDIIVPEGFYGPAPHGTFASNLWPGGVVPYEFDANVSAPRQAAMLVAMADWEAVATVDFRRFTFSAKSPPAKTGIQPGALRVLPADRR